MKNCCYCMNEATYTELDPNPPAADSERKKKDRHYCERHMFERIADNKEQERKLKKSNIITIPT